jgi:general secretion pathway protein F
MPTFLYKAVTESHEIVQGEMDAPGKEAVIERLRSLGHLPLDAREIGASRHPIQLGWATFARPRVSSRDVLLITHELATLLKAGVALDRAFGILIDVGEKEATQRLLSAILNRLRSGISLAEALMEQGNTFPPYYATMVRAGEASGALDIVLGRLGEFLEKSQNLRESVKTALYYPIFLIIMAGLSLVVLLTFVLPQFKPLFESAGAALPVSTRILMAIGDSARDYGWQGLVGLVAVFYSVRRYLATADGRRRWDAFVISLPLVGSLITKVEVARFSRTASTLLHNGVGLLNTLQIVGDTLSNSVIASSIESVAALVKEGRGLSDPLMATGLFPKLVVHLVRVGEETGKLDEMLSKLADIYDEEVGRTTARLLALLVPVVTIGMGVLIAGIIGSILTAILSVNSLAF